LSTTVLLLTMQCSEASVIVYDSTLHREVLLSTVKALVADEKMIRVSTMDTEMQPTPNCCGIFAISIMTMIAYASEP